MRKTIKNQMLSRIYGRGRGWCFTPNDFVVDFDANDIKGALLSLTKSGTIRRISRGLYDYPIYSEILQKYVAPDMSKASQAIARRFAWRIQPDGETALNYLGLSNQITSKYLYFSDGPSKKYDIMGQIIEFKHHTFKEASITNDNAILVTQAIKYTGESNITDEFKSKLKSKFTAKEWEKIKQFSVKAVGWVYNVIVDIARNDK